MCIAIWKPHGATVDEKTLTKCFNTNKDGAGFMYARNGKVCIYKGFFELDRFLKALAKHTPLADAAGSGMAIHCRIKTHGKTDVHNCHPHRVVGYNMAFIHNGVIHLNGYNANTGESDSIDFCRRVLYHLPTNWLEFPMIRTLVADFIGRYNKVVFMDSTGKVHIINEDQGEWSKGVWYSNSGYKTFTTRRVFTHGRDGTGGGAYGYQHGAADSCDNS